MNRLVVLLAFVGLLALAAPAVAVVPDVGSINATCSTYVVSVATGPNYSPTVHTAFQGCVHVLGS